MDSNFQSSSDQRTEWATLLNVLISKPLFSYIDSIFSDFSNFSWISQLYLIFKALTYVRTFFFNISLYMAQFILPSIIWFPISCDKNSSIPLLCPLHAPQLGWCSLTLFISLGWVSCWNTQLCLFFKSLTYLMQFWFNIPQYRTHFILSLNMWICSVPWDENIPLCCHLHQSTWLEFFAQTWCELRPNN